MASGDQSGFIVRSAKTREEVSELWWPLMKELQWNRDHDDAITHYHVANKGADWLLLVSKETDKPEGCVVAFTYANSTGWVGFFCMNAALRGRGHGRDLWKALEASYEACHTAMVGLDGVEQQVNTYKRRGFEDCARIKLMVHPSLREKPLTLTKAKLDEGVEIVDIREVDIHALAGLDLALNGLDRKALWTEEALFARKDAYGYAILSSNDLTGFILVRRCQHGHRIGPLYAENGQQATVLLQLAMEQVKDSEGSYIAEVFGTNASGQAAFERLGWIWAGIDYHRMWLHGKIPKAQQPDGRGAKNMFAIFDAAQG